MNTKSRSAPLGRAFACLQVTPRTGPRSPSRGARLAKKKPTVARGVAHLARARRRRAAGLMDAIADGHAVLTTGEVFLSRAADPTMHPMSMLFLTEPPRSATGPRLHPSYIVDVDGEVCGARARKIGTNSQLAARKAKHRRQPAQPPYKQRASMIPKAVVTSWRTTLAP
jgi:hypothetical protein